MKNKIMLLILLSFFLQAAPAYAISGACSTHGGVDCSAGAGAYGQVTCNDGWTGSSVSYSSMAECKTPPVNSNTLFGLKRQCASYTSIIENEIINADASSEANSKIHPDAAMVAMLGEVFYSPVVNSCLYTQTIYVKVPSVTLPDGKVIPASSGTTYSVNDYLNNESQLYAVVVDSSDTNSPKVTAFNNEVAYYKGETSAQTVTLPTAMSGLLQSARNVANPKSKPSSTIATTIVATTTQSADVQPAVRASMLQAIYTFCAHLFGF